LRVTLPVMSSMEKVFSGMVMLGALMVLQYAYWRYQRELERATRQHLQAEPRSRVL
jgi:hypothetical protein